MALSRSCSSIMSSAADSAAAWSAYADELTKARAEIERLRAENASLRSQLYDLQTRQPPPGAPHVPPPMFYPPPQSVAPYSYGPPPVYGGYAPPMHEKPPPRPQIAPLAINAENKRGPKGANLALFCIPNSYTDQQVYDLAAPHGNVVFAQVSTHRDTGLSRGYAFVSYETVEQANKAMSALHNLAVEGRSLRCEIARSDREQGGSKPY